jgi:Spy/CpxP family protein refolding chaperone
MNTKSIVVFGIAVFSLCALPAFAYGPFSGRGGGECRYDRPGPACDLTEEQQTRLRELRQDFQDRTRDLREELWTKRQEMRTILGSDTPDEKQLRQMQKEVNALQTRLGDARIDHMLEVKKVNPQAFAGYGRGYGRHAGRSDWGTCSPGWRQGKNISSKL